MTITVRSALRDELERVNELRRQVNDVHVSGRPDIFRPGFSPELSNHVYEQFESGEYEIFVAESDDGIVGFAVTTVVHKPLSPYNNARSFYRVEEFGVDEQCRRMGVASALVEFLKTDAKSKGLTRIELDMWEFNQGALAFYEAAGFTTYRRYMEMNIE